MRLSDALLGLGHAIPYYPRLAETLGSTNGAIMLAQMFFWSQHEADKEGWVKKSWKDIEQSTGLSRRKQRPAREALVELGVLQTHKNGENATMHYRINWQGLEQLWPVATKGNNRLPPNVTTGCDKTSQDTFIQDPIKTHGDVSPKTPVIAAVATPDRIAEGVLDHIPKSTLLSKEMDPMLSVLVDYWKALWGKSKGRVALTDERRKAFRKAVREGWMPSDFVRAMRGMRHDNWPDRYKYNEWKHIVRDMDKWIALDDSNKGRKPPSITMEVDGRIIRGLRVPKDYKWTQADEHCLANGWTWTGTGWERPTN